MLAGYSSFWVCGLLLWWLLLWRRGCSAGLHSSLAQGFVARGMWDLPGPVSLALQVSLNHWATRERPRTSLGWSALTGLVVVRLH